MSRGSLFRDGGDRRPSGRQSIVVGRPGTPTALLLLLALFAALFTAPASAQTGGSDIFRIGGYVTGLDSSGGDFTLRFGPSLQEYLEQSLPGLSFELVSLNSSTVYDAVASQSIDFLFTDPATFVCMSVEFDATVLATRSNLLLRWESNYIATAIIARSDREDISTFSDLVGKRVGTSSFRTITDIVRGRGMWNGGRIGPCWIDLLFAPTVDFFNAGKAPLLPPQSLDRQSARPSRHFGGAFPVGLKPPPRVDVAARRTARHPQCPDRPSSPPLFSPPRAFCIAVPVSPSPVSGRPSASCRTLACASSSTPPR